MLFSGIIREGDGLLVGPLLDGGFLPAQVKSIHRYRVPRRMVRAGQAATLCLPQIEGSQLRKVENPFSTDSFIGFCMKNSLGYGTRLFDIRTQSMFRIRCGGLSRHASHYYTNSKRFRNDCFDRKYLSDGTDHRNRHSMFRNS